MFALAVVPEAKFPLVSLFSSPLLSFCFLETPS